MLGWSVWLRAGFRPLSRRKGRVEPGPNATSTAEIRYVGLTSTSAGRRQRIFYAEPFATTIRAVSGLSR
jgi:hypothetical protein